MTIGNKHRFVSSPMLSGAATLVGVFLVAPILVIALQSFSSSRYLAFPPPGYSLRWYRALVGDDSWHDSLLVSLEVASAVSILATFLGTSAAVGLTRWPGKRRELWLSYLLAPMIVPAIVTAVSTFLLFSTISLTETRIGLVIAHSVLATPLVMLSTMSSLDGIDHSLELMARTLGAGPVRAFRTVTLPLILPGVLTGALFAFIASFDELVVAMFLTGTRVVSLPKRMWDGIHFEIDPTVSAVSTLIVLFTSGLVLAVGYASRRLSKHSSLQEAAPTQSGGTASGLTLEPKSEALSR